MTHRRIITALVLAGLAGTASAQALRPPAAPPVPRLEVAASTTALIRETRTEPLLRVIAPNGVAQLAIRTDGTLQLRGTTVDFDPHVYPTAGPLIAYVPVQVGGLVVLMPIYELPEGVAK